MMINRNKNTEEYRTYFKNLTCWGNFMSQGCQRLTCSGFFLFVIIFPYHPLYQSSWKKSDYPQRLRISPSLWVLLLPGHYTTNCSSGLPEKGTSTLHWSNEAWAFWGILNRHSITAPHGEKPTGISENSGFPSWSWIIFTKSFPLARLDLLVLNSEGGTSIQRKTNHLDSTA